MSNIKLGKLTEGNEGESLNDVETALDGVGIKLRDNTGNWRSFEKVLDEVGAKWKNLSSIEQSALSTAIAGKLKPCA